MWRFINNKQNETSNTVQYEQRRRDFQKGLG